MAAGSWNRLCCGFVFPVCARVPAASTDDKRGFGSANVHSDSLPGLSTSEENVGAFVTFSLVSPFASRLSAIELIGDEKKKKRRVLLQIRFMGLEQ